MKVKINKDACIGCGVCEAMAPDVFGMGSDGKAEVIGNVTPENEAAVNEAMDSCPVAAIEEDD